MDTSTSGFSSPPQDDEIVVGHKHVSDSSVSVLEDGTRTTEVPKAAFLPNPDVKRAPASAINGHTNKTSDPDRHLSGTENAATQVLTPLNDQIKIKSGFHKPIQPNSVNSIASETTTPLHNTPQSASRGRGRSVGRGRGGRSRGSVRGGRGGKRKRGSDGHPSDLDDDEDSDSSEVYTPIATQTKSGRAITKPATFVPPPLPAPPSSTSATFASPISGGNKRKRVYRRNPEAAVCKSCLRGTSPAMNMIVFCDGCNSAYHRYCHHPPIDQSVVDQVDKEWFCLDCEQERAVSLAPPGVVDVSGFVSMDARIPEQDRRRFFSTLTYGTLVSLLTASTTLVPTLPVYTPSFRATRHIDDAASAGFDVKPSIPTSNPNTKLDEPVPDEHPPHYPRPGYGLMASLPPDRVDAEYLVDEEDRYGVFSHVYQTDTTVANQAVVTKPTSKRVKT